MQYQDAQNQINGYRKQISQLREEMRKVQSGVEPVEVEDYEFSTSNGSVKLSDLFGENDTLFVVHNMGKSCPACTMWADGFNGVYDHLKSRAPFIVSSPDSPEAQQKFAAKRNWVFPMASHEGTSFAKDMGYKSDEHGFMPGVSIFKKQSGKIMRVSDTCFQPGDDFCATWHILDMLPEGRDGWHPKFNYG